MTVDRSPLRAARPSDAAGRLAGAVTHFLAAPGRAPQDAFKRSGNYRAMNDRRMLRRYLVMVSHAEEVLEASFGEEATPPPAEAVALIEDLVSALDPAIRRMPAAAPRPQEIAETLAGWVH